MMAARAASASSLHTSTASRIGGTAASYDGTTNENGEPHGEGKRVFASGHVYEGQWVNGRCDGFGRFSYPDGQVFEGEWKEGKRNGEGKLAMPSGETIAGTWSNDTLTGPVRRYYDGEMGPPAPAVSRRENVPAVAMNAGGGSGGSGAPAGDAAEMAWLRESHDVIWQLNVELQMENERLVGENRRLRLKLRQLLQSGGGGNSSSGNSSSGGNATGAGAPKAADQHGGGADGNGRIKVVEGRLRRRKKDDKGGGKSGGTPAELGLIAKLLSERGVTSDVDAFLASTQTPATSDVDAFLASSAAAGRGPPAKDDRDSRRQVVEELCDKAESELTNRLLGREWEASVKRLDRPGEVDAFARATLKAAIDPVRAKAVLSGGPSSDAELSDLADLVRDGLRMVLGWPDGVAMAMSRSGLSAEGLAAARELRLDGCGFTEEHAGALCCLVRGNRALETLDLGSNALGDAGATMLAEALTRSPNAGLKLLRLNGNRIGGKGGGALAAMLATARAPQTLDLRGNAIDHLNEQALRQATPSGGRVLLHESDGGGGGGGDGLVDADEFLAHSGKGGRASASSDANAFIGDIDRRRGGGGSGGAPNIASDADAFLSFSSRR